MTKRTIFACLLVVTLGLVSALEAKVAIGVIAGTVVDARGKPVSGATVTMQTSDSKDAFATHTDANGNFQFARYRIGQYDLRAYAKGMYSPWARRIAIRTGKTTLVTLHLPPAANESVTVSNSAEKQ